jgi:Golgi nucleoside diphosphatase
MRLLPNSSQIEILTTACTFIQQNYPFYVSQCEKHFRVISGEMEGIYGWLTVNYLKKGLSSLISNSEEFVKSFGFLDMVCLSGQVEMKVTHGNGRTRVVHQRKLHLSLPRKWPTNILTI